MALKSIVYLPHLKFKHQCSATRKYALLWAPLSAFFLLQFIEQHNYENNINTVHRSNRPPTCDCCQNEVNSIHHTNVHTIILY